MRQLTYGIALDCDLALGVAATAAPAEVTVRRAAGAVDVSTVSWLDRTSDPRMSAGLRGTEFYLGFADAEFVIGADGRTVRWHALTGGPDATLVHLLLDHVLPRVLTRGDAVVLHGSCVADAAGHCVAIVGSSGSGKSTLAAALLADGRRLVGDDAVTVRWRDGRPLVAAAYSGLRLDARSVGLAAPAGSVSGGAVSTYGGKVRVVPPADAVAPDGGRYPLAAVVLLPDPAEPAPEAEPEVLRLAPVAAGIALVRHSVHLNGPGERGLLPRRVLPLAEGVPVFRLRYDRETATLDAAARLIVHLLAEASREPAT